jgi:hypothetical protein
MSNLAHDSNFRYYPGMVGKYGATQVLTAGAASSQSTAFGTETTLVRLATTNLTGSGAHVHYITGSNPTANTTTCPELPCGMVEYIVVNPGDKIAVMRGASTDISVSVTEITN